MNHAIPFYGWVPVIFSKLSWTAVVFSNNHSTLTHSFTVWEMLAGMVCQVFIISGGINWGQLVNSWQPWLVFAHKPGTYMGTAGRLNCTGSLPFRNLWVFLHHLSSSTVILFIWQFQCTRVSLPKSPDGNFKASNDLATEIPAHCGDHPTSKKGVQWMNMAFSSWKLDVFPLDGRCIKEFMVSLICHRYEVNFISLWLSMPKKAILVIGHQAISPVNRMYIPAFSYSLHSNTLSSGVLPLGI